MLCVAGKFTPATSSAVLMGGSITRSSSPSKDYILGFQPQKSSSPSSAVPLLSSPLHQKIIVDSIIGKGGFSIVYHGQYSSTHNVNSLSSSHQHIAIKKINIIKLLHSTTSPPPTPNTASAMDVENGNIYHHTLRLLYQELDVYKRIISHEFIVKLHHAFHYNIYCYLVMDCLLGGNLRNILHYERYLNEKSVVYIIGCIGTALYYIHSRGVIHRDIKPDNIGLNEFGQPYLTDFGISYMSNDQHKLHLLCNSSSGTLAYMAPEALAPGHCHSYQSDFWSLGVMAYELYFSRRPFHKHCPPRAIQFVANEYGSMWQKLKVTNDISHTSFDFQPIRSADEILPFPNLDLEFNADGTVPACLLLSNPSKPSASSTPSTHSDASSSFGSQLVSPEFMDLLSGLLDVRIPNRLGNFQRFDEFTHHSCFLLNDISFSEMTQLPSPLLRKWPPHSTPLPQPRLLTHSDSYYQLPPEIENGLCDYQYINPSSNAQALKDRHDRNKTLDMTLHTDKLTGLSSTHH